MTIDTTKIYKYTFDTFHQKLAKERKKQKIFQKVIKLS